MRSATSGASPFVSTISQRTSAHGSLSSLSTALQIARNLAGSTPHAANMPSSSWRWLTLTANRPSRSPPRISLTILTHSASGSIGSVPLRGSVAMSMSHW